MLRLEIKKAAHGLSQSASGVGEQSSIQIQGNGLNANLMAKGLPVADRHVAGLHEARADGSGRRPSWANMPVPLRSKRCGGRSPRCNRRMTAAPFLDLVAAFLFDGIRTHGLIAPALYRFCGLMPCGRLLRLPFPIARYFLHPHGVAHPVGRMDGFRQFAIGASHE